MTIALCSVYANDQYTRDMYKRILFDLLAERKPWQNISHNKMPTWEDHVKFVDSKPYRDWYIIQKLDDYTFCGAVYLTKNDEIGIFLFERYQHWGLGDKVLETLYSLYPKVKYFLANVSPNNSASLAFFTNHGFYWTSTMIDEETDTVIQHTLTKVNPIYVDEQSGDHAREPLQGDHQPAQPAE